MLLQISKGFKRLGSRYWEYSHGSRDTLRENGVAIEQVIVDCAWRRRGVRKSLIGHGHNPIRERYAARFASCDHSNEMAHYDPRLNSERLPNGIDSVTVSPSVRAR
jgi:hypothetical protein